jgi:hypothetical protein
MGVDGHHINGPASTLGQELTAAPRAEATAPVDLGCGGALEFVSPRC